MALSGDMMAVAGGDSLTLLDTAQHVVVGTLQLPWDIDEVAISPSGRFVMAAPAPPRSEVVLHDRALGTTTNLPSRGEGWLAGFDFMEHPVGELLVIARDQHNFTLYNARGGLEELGRVQGGDFEFDSFTALSQRLLASVGHVTGETRDSLVVIPLPSAFKDLSAAAAAVREELDFAYRLIAGPAIPNGLVAFRDPEDAETPDPEDEDEDEDEDADSSGLRGFLGIYVRDVHTRKVTERITWDGPVKRGDRCFATEAWVAIAMRTHFALVPRHAGAESQLIRTQAAALDPTHRRIAFVTTMGQYDLLTL